MPVPFQLTAAALSASLTIGKSRTRGDGTITRFDTIGVTSQ
jgi:hypothetical protein